MSFTTIKLAPSATKGVSVLTLARPKKKNAINVVMYNEIKNALQQVAKDEDTKALVITGEGSYYSSGNDLSNFAQLTHPKKMARDAKYLCYEFVDSFVEFPKPLIAAVNGPAIGIPVTTMGLCDARFSVPSATFQTPFKQLAQAPEGCSSFMFPRLMGKENAKKVLNDGWKFTAPEGVEIGFIDALSDEVVGHSVDYAAQLVDKGIARFVQQEAGLKQELQKVNAYEVDVLEKAWISPECLTALDKYLISRKARGPAYMLRAINYSRFIWDRW